MKASRSSDPVSTPNNQTAISSIGQTAPNATGQTAPNSGESNGAESNPAEPNSAEPIEKAALATIRAGKILVARSFGKDTFYLPGGKPEFGETMREALEREIREELSADLQSETIRELGTFTAEAHGKQNGRQVNMHTFTAELTSAPEAFEEIEELAWFGVENRAQLSQASQLILDDLTRKSLVNESEKPNRVVLFDLDDTLFFTREAKWAHHRFVAKDSFGIELTDETLREHWGKPFTEMIALLYQNAGTPEEMLAANRASNARFPKQPIPGALETVEKLLDDGVAVGVITSTVTERAVRELTDHGYPMERIFVVQGADQSEFHKPDPRVFDEVSGYLRGFGKTEVTYVGDALTDEAAAHEAGFTFAAATTGLFEAEDFRQDSIVLKDITDLPNRI